MRMQILTVISSDALETNISHLKETETMFFCLNNML